MPTDNITYIGVVNLDDGTYAVKNSFNNVPVEGIYQTALEAAFAHDRAMDAFRAQIAQDPRLTTTQKSEKLVNCLYNSYPEVYQSEYTGNATIDCSVPPKGISPEYSSLKISVKVGNKSLTSRCKKLPAAISILIKFLKQAYAETPSAIILARIQQATYYQLCLKQMPITIAQNSEPAKIKRQRVCPRKIEPIKITQDTTTYNDDGIQDLLELYDSIEPITNTLTNDPNTKTQTTTTTSTDAPKLEMLLYSPNIYWQIIGELPKGESIGSGLFVAKSTFEKFTRKICIFIRHNVGDEIIDTALVCPPYAEPYVKNIFRFLLRPENQAAHRAVFEQGFIFRHSTTHEYSHEYVNVYKDKYITVNDLQQTPALIFSSTTSSHASSTPSPRHAIDVERSTKRVKLG